VAAGPSTASPGAGPPASARTATGTAVLPVPAGMEPPDAPVAEGGTTVSPAEETALMEPIADEPDGSAPGPEADQGGATQVVEVPREGAQAQEAADEQGSAGAPTQIAPLHI